MNHPFAITQNYRGTKITQELKYYIKNSKLMIFGKKFQFLCVELCVGKSLSRLVVFISTPIYITLT